MSKNVKQTINRLESVHRALIELILYYTTSNREKLKNFKFTENGFIANDYNIEVIDGIDSFITDGVFVKMSVDFLNQLLDMFLKDRQHTVELIKQCRKECETLKKMKEVSISKFEAVIDRRIVRNFQQRKNLTETYNDFKPAFKLLREQQKKGIEYFHLVYALWLRHQHDYMMYPNMRNNDLFKIVEYSPIVSILAERESIMGRIKTLFDELGYYH
ncbi:hypothetical protein ACET7H_17505 [Aeromonas veronii]